MRSLNLDIDERIENQCRRGQMMEFLRRDQIRFDLEDSQCCLWSMNANLTR